VSILISRGRIIENRIAVLLLSLVLSILLLQHHWTDEGVFVCDTKETYNQA